MPKETENLQADRCHEGLVSDQDAREIQDLYGKLLASDAKLVGPDGRTQLLPTNLYAFLCQLLADLKQGKSVSILQSEASLTTVEAAKLLGTSRQFFVNLLENNELPFFMVGTHRRIYARHVLAYKAQRDAVRRSTLDALARSEFEDGLYEVRSSIDPDSEQ